MASEKIEYIPCAVFPANTDFDELRRELQDYLRETRKPEKKRPRRNRVARLTAAVLSKTVVVPSDGE